MKTGPKTLPKSHLFARRISMPESPDDCIEWPGARLAEGYGVFGGTTAHRAAYTIFVGDPGPLVVDHLCRNRACVNVLHLEAVSQLENTKRGDLVDRRTHCHRGHPITIENTIIENEGHRRCRICKADKQRRAEVKFLAEGRNRCLDCDTAVSRKAKRCPHCTAIERESRPDVKAARSQRSKQVGVRFCA